MFSSKDFEKLWFFDERSDKVDYLCKTEGVPEEESINSFCEKNGVPYEEFDKWFRKTHQAVGRVEIEDIPGDEPMLKSSRRRGHKSDLEGILVTIQTSDGLHIRKDGEYAISNYAAEQAIRPQTVQRKNSLFYCSTKGAVNSAIYNTFIETCKQAGIPFREYFRRVILELKHGRTDYANLLPMSIGLKRY